MDAQILVSIVCNAFNQKDYITDALESFLAQKTDFAFEVLVHDDASTDGTAEIIRDYSDRYPDIIKPVFQTVNRYSKRIPITLTYQIPRARGKYIAFCEGDDYFTDPLKLQKQADALEAHPEIDICAHSVRVINGTTGTFISMIAPAAHDTIFSTQEVIEGGGGFVGTNSLMYRREIEINAPKFRTMSSTDYSLQILGSLRGGLLYLGETMSDYRSQSIGSWSAAMSSNPEKRKKSLQRSKEMLMQCDQDTGYLYTASIQKTIHKREWEELLHQPNLHNYRIMKKKPYRSFYKELPFKKRCKIALKAYSPWMLRRKQKLTKQR